MKIDMIRRPLSTRVWALAAIVLLFVAANAVLTAMSVPGAAVTHGKDVGTWYRPALALVEHGTLDVSSDSADLDFRRPPVYPIFIAGTIQLAGDRYADLLIPLQIMILFATGAVAAFFTEQLLPGYGLAALALVTLNPNALGTSHLVQSETLFALLITCLVAVILAYHRRPRVKTAAAAGAIIGVAALTRPEGQFLAVFIPAVLVALPMLSKAKAPPRFLLAPAVCFLAAMAIMTPWMARNYTHGVGFSLTNYSTLNYYLWSSAAEVAMQQHGIGSAEARARMLKQRDAFVASQGESWSRLSRPEQDRRLFAAAVRAIFSHQPTAIAATVSSATLQFFTAGGAGNFLNLVGLESENAFQIFVEEKHSSYFAAWRSAMSSAGLATVLITVVALGFVVILRILGLVGLVVMARRGQWQVMLMAIGIVAFFALIIPFFGNSRFRVGVEPLLILFALYGVDGLRKARTVLGARHGPG